MASLIKSDCKDLNIGRKPKIKNTLHLFNLNQRTKRLLLLLWNCWLLYVIITPEIFLLFQNLKLKLVRGFESLYFPAGFLFNLNDLHVHTQGFGSIILMPVMKHSGYSTKLISRRRNHSSLIATEHLWHCKEIKAKVIMFG